ncbi:high affinity nitrate transporter 2.6-like protein, partial [Tanacetum coccineum]
NDVSVEFDAFGFSVKDYQTRQLILRCDRNGDIYPVTHQPSSIPLPLLSFSNSTCHRRFGHLGEDVLRNLVSRRLINCNSSKESNLCHACQLGKHVKLPFYSAESHVESVFDIIHSDLGTSPTSRRKRGKDLKFKFQNHLAHSYAQGQPTSNVCNLNVVRKRVNSGYVVKNVLIDMGDIIDTIDVEGFYTCNVRVEYEWKPTRCACCKVFGHVQLECPKNIDSDVVKNMKKPSQTPRGVPVGPKVGFKPVNQVYRHVSKKNNVNTNGNKKKDVELTIKVSNSNLFDVLNSVENDVNLGTNGGTLNLASKNANSSGSSFWNVESSSTSTTPIVEKIDIMERLIIKGKDEVASVDNDMANFLASKKVGYGTNSLLEQWKESYVNGDCDFDPYDDDMYEGQDIRDKIQDICDNLDIKV